MTTQYIIGALVKFIDEQFTTTDIRYGYITSISSTHYYIKGWSTGISYRVLHEKVLGEYKDINELFSIADPEENNSYEDYDRAMRGI